jgi:hypothetical protein
MKFCLGHGPLQAQEETVIKMGRIVSTVFVENQGIGEHADLEQSVRVCIVPRQAGHLQSKDDTGASQAHFRNQFLESFAIRR